MKCHGCGHEFPGTASRCPRCHRSTSKRSRTSKDSRLLEFPKRLRVPSPAEATAPALPSWRIELNEKVRAIRARRSAPGPQVDVVYDEPVKSIDVESRASLASARTDEQRTSFARDASLRATSRPEPREQVAAPAVPTRRTSSNIVEAALTRVKRASENASRAALPKIEPARSVQASSQVALALDRQATARALAPLPEEEPRAELAPALRPEVIQPPIIKPAKVEVSLPQERRAEAPVKATTQALQTSLTEESVEASSMPVIDELEPLDYLEAEIRKVDKALGAEFLRNESPSILTHAVIGVVDLLSVAVSCSPFLAIIRIADGSFSTTQTRVSSGIIIALISFFYLALTQIVGGRTFGMMLTNTRVVDAATFEAPSAPRALLRTAGYFIAVAPVILGIIWTAFNHKHRGWQDFLSDTVVVRDF